MKESRFLLSFALLFVVAQKVHAQNAPVALRAVPIIQDVEKPKTQALFPNEDNLQSLSSEETKALDKALASVRNEFVEREMIALQIAYLEYQQDPSYPSNLPEDFLKHTKYFTELSQLAEPEFLARVDYYSPLNKRSEGDEIDGNVPNIIQDNDRFTAQSDLYNQAFFVKRSSSNKNNHHALKTYDAKNPEEEPLWNDYFSRYQLLSGCHAIPGMNHSGGMNLMLTSRKSEDGELYPDIMTPVGGPLWDKASIIGLQLIGSSEPLVPTRWSFKSTKDHLGYVPHVEAQADPHSPKVEYRIYPSKDHGRAIGTFTVNPGPSGRWWVFKNVDDGQPWEDFSGDPRDDFYGMSNAIECWDGSIGVFEKGKPAMTRNVYQPGIMIHGRCKMGCGFSGCSGLRAPDAKANLDRNLKMMSDAAKDNLPNWYEQMLQMALKRNEDPALQGINEDTLRARLSKRMVAWYNVKLDDVPFGGAYFTRELSDQLVDDYMMDELYGEHSRWGLQLKSDYGIDKNGSVLRSFLTNLTKMTGILYTRKNNPYLYYNPNSDRLTSHKKLDLRDEEAAYLRARRDYTDRAFYEMISRLYEDFAHKSHCAAELKKWRDRVVDAGLFRTLDEQPTMFAHGKAHYPDGEKYWEPEGGHIDDYHGQGDGYYYRRIFGESPSVVPLPVPVYRGPPPRRRGGLFPWRY